MVFHWPFQQGSIVSRVGWEFLPNPRVPGPTRTISTWPNPTLICRVLPDLIKNRVRFGFIKKKKIEVGPGWV